ncbi:MAG: tRNA pseudouridine(55) synthase TruB [Pirellulaceae bacterium]
MFGILNLYKPSGITSRDAVSNISNRIRRTKIGHAGTLDPLADGVLLLAFGQATRLISYVQDLPKEYEARFRFGIESDTQDIEGKCVSKELNPISREDIESALARFTGTIEQVPPAYSAIKIGGKRSYDLARAGKAVELKARQVNVHSLALTHFDFPDFGLRIECGKGTYVRTLGVDLARSLANVCVMTGLTRTAVGHFRHENAIRGEDFLAGRWVESLQSPTEALSGWESVVLSPNQQLDAINGNRPKLEAKTDQVLGVDEQGNLKAILERSSGNEFRFLINFMGR